MEVIKKILAVPTIMIGIYYGIKIMIIGMMINTLIAYFLNSYYSGKFIDYPISAQVKDILPALILAVLLGLIVFVIGNFLDVSNLWKLITQILIGALLFIGIAEASKMDDYLYIKGIVF